MAFGKFYHTIDMINVVLPVSMVFDEGMKMGVLSELSRLFNIRSRYCHLYLFGKEKLLMNPRHMWADAL